MKAAPPRAWLDCRDFLRFVFFSKKAECLSRKIYFTVAILPVFMNFNIYLFQKADYFFEEVLSHRSL